MAPPDAPPSRSDADELLADDDDDFDDETCIEAFVFTLQGLPEEDRQISTRAPTAPITG